MTHSTSGEEVHTTIKFNESTPLNDEFKAAVVEALEEVLVEYDMTGHTYTIDVHPND